jgi:hypothetical protein
VGTMDPVIGGVARVEAEDVGQAVREADCAAVVDKVALVVEVVVRRSVEVAVTLAVVDAVQKIETDEVADEETEVVTRALLALTVEKADVVIIPSEEPLRLAE